VTAGLHVELSHCAPLWLYCCNSQYIISLIHLHAPALVAWRRYELCWVASCYLSVVVPCSRRIWLSVSCVILSWFVVGLWMMR